MSILTLKIEKIFIFYLPKEATEMNTFFVNVISVLFGDSQPFVSCIPPEILLLNCIFSVAKTMFFFQKA